MDGNAVNFWQSGNLWRTLSFPVLYVVTAVVFLQSLGAVAVYCAVWLIIAVVEFIVPSLINGQALNYTTRQRIGWGIFHAWAWTSFAMGITILLGAIVARLFW